MPGNFRCIWLPAEGLGEDELVQEAVSCAEVLLSAATQHNKAEGSLLAGNPHGAIAAAESGLKQLDSCLSHSQVRSIDQTSSPCVPVSG